MADKQVTPFQLTDQFTMENFNQRIEETNTALANNDPRNWGLGANAKLLTSADNLDNIKENGWYWWYDSIPSGAKDEYCHMTIDNGQSEETNTITQTIYRNGLNDVTVRFYKGEKWITEYINPPMYLGVEYRTTERYMGKPVYVKAVDFGAMPNNTVKIVTFGDSTTRVISAHGIMNGGYVIPGCTGSSDYPAQEMQIFTEDGGKVGIATHTDRTGYTAVVIVKYWKTTD